jgi:glucose-1-phosphate thymidylyltransferase
LNRGKLKVSLLGRGFAWLDTGTFESLQQASSYVQAIQERQGLQIACIEEIAFHQGYINAVQLQTLANEMRNNDYGKYILEILREYREDTNQ